MSEADTHNNQPLPEPDSPGDDNLFGLKNTTPAEDSPTVNNSDVTEGQDTTQSSPQPVAPSSAIIKADVATDDTSEESEQLARNQDWYALAQRMRQHNHLLIEQVNQLKQALHEKHEELQQIQVFVQERETLLAQQAEEFQAVKTQLTRLFQTLESSHQTAQRQQILIETLSEQSQNYQERIAQMERECALTQQHCNEQSHQLLEAVNTCRELQSRLHRQQRQTLHYKSALEKCLEMPASASASEVQQSQAESTSTAPSVFHKTQPIQPWSAEPMILPDGSDFNESWQLSEEQEAVSREDRVSDRVSRLEDRRERAVPAPESGQSWIPEIIQSSEPSQLPSPTQTPATDSEPSEDSIWATNEVEDNPWQEPFADEAEATESESPASKEVQLPQSGWPSPVLYPLRPPRKIESMAAIELPSFPRHD